MKPVIIFQPGMAGDLLFIQKIVKTYAAGGRRVILPVRETHKWVYDALVMPETVETPILEGDFDFRDEVLFLADKIALSPIDANAYTFLSLFFSWRYAPEQTMDLKYQVSGVEMDGWADHVTLRRDLEKEERLFVEGVDEYVSVGGHLVSAPYAGVVEFRDGKIIGLREYFDMGSVNALKAGEPMKEHVRAMIAREAVG